MRFARAKFELLRHYAPPPLPPSSAARRMGSSHRRGCLSTSAHEGTGELERAARPAPPLAADGSAARSPCARLVAPSQHGAVVAAGAASGAPARAAPADAALQPRPASATPASAARPEPRRPCRAQRQGDVLAPDASRQCVGGESGEPSPGESSGARPPSNLRPDRGRSAAGCTAWKQPRGRRSPSAGGGSTLGWSVSGRDAASIRAVTRTRTRHVAPLLGSLADVMNGDDGSARGDRAARRRNHKPAASLKLGGFWPRGGVRAHESTLTATSVAATVRKRRRRFFFGSRTRLRGEGGPHRAPARARWFCYRSSARAAAAAATRAAGAASPDQRVRAGPGLASPSRGEPDAPAAALGDVACSAAVLRCWRTCRSRTSARGATRSRTSLAARGPPPMEIPGDGPTGAVEMNGAVAGATALNPARR